MNNYEFDKIVSAIAFGIITLLLAINIGDIIYYSGISDEKRGYTIDISDLEDEKVVAVDDASKEDNIDVYKLLSDADYVNGEKIFKKCSICHTIANGGGNKVGPNLWNIIDSKVAENKTFAYSSAMKNKAEEGNVWTIQELIKYLKSPKKYVPGTKMAFAGIKKLQDRADLLKFLQNYGKK
ncbi:MAG: cytochrome c [Candidatus Midichloriaceae bacterium]